jgi:hypothetical protein
MTCALARLSCVAVREVYTVIPQLLGGPLKRFVTRNSQTVNCRARFGAFVASPRFPP